MATVIGKPVGKVALGIMGMSVYDTTDTEGSIKAIKAGVDAGENLINSANFYGPHSNPYASLELLNAFFEAHPDYVDKTIVCVKGGMVFAEQKLSGEIGFLREQVSDIQAKLGQRKKLDVLVIARMPVDVDVETLIKNLATLQAEGLFTGIGLSEVSAKTLRRAHAVHPISTVENELSLFNFDEEALEVVKACDELKIAYTAYSPLGRGFLTNKFDGMDGLPKDDRRNMFPRFQGENFKKNQELGAKIQEIAKSKGITGPQLALAYLMRLSPWVIPLQGSSKADRIVENHQAVNVELTSEDIKAVDSILASFQVQGDRYPPMFMDYCMR